ncbi:MAG: cob(I)yrinic acid a,c-diamide adenosyltransferase [Elusimicrobia bacterium]|jgi:cob(I)alamin adenosyltransferase|nr:cob(I)yrinic acid a,c-diamide adenosyltransferase [Elusimicrobiota bacterium]
MTGHKKRLYIYTGEGKGKTTAATGQTVRAASSGLKTLFVYFNKMPPEKGGEAKILKSLDNVTVKYFAKKHPAFFSETNSPGTDTYDMTAETLKGLEFIKDNLKKNDIDIVVLDEILISVRDGFIKEEILIKFINNYIKSSEVILTGRRAGPAIIKKADLVSDIANVKHYYSKRNTARQGIEI